VVIIEVLVICDDCSDAYGGDDRDKTAAEIRATRKRYGWIQRGSRDYCDKCAPKHVGRGGKAEQEQKWVPEK
jgi:hypothetical protein